MSKNHYYNAKSVEKEIENRFTIEELLTNITEINAKSQELELVFHIIIIE